MRDADVFEGAYSRLDATRLPTEQRATGGASGRPGGPARSLRDTPRSRLLPRLALMAPRGRARLPDAAE